MVKNLSRCPEYRRTAPEMARAPNGNLIEPKRSLRDRNLVDIWRIGPAERDTELHCCYEVLSVDEILRARRFHFDKHRRAFIMTRGTMRQILSLYTNITPADLSFRYGRRGKPRLSNEVNNYLDIRFSISHSGNLSLLAVTRGLEIGVDVEAMNPKLPLEEIAKRFFSANENRKLWQLPLALQAECFFSCWTRKEAYLKALGEGLAVPLDSFDVAFGPGVRAALLEVRTNNSEASRWSMYNVAVAKGYKAALVVEGKNHKLHQRQWHSRAIKHDS